MRGLEAALQTSYGKHSGREGQLEMNLRCVGVLAPVDDLVEIGREWRALESRAEGSFFLSWGWLGPWARKFSGHTTLYLFRCQREGRVIGLAFLTQRRVQRRKGIIRPRQLQLNEFNGPELDMIIEYNGILSAPQDASDCWNAFGDAVRRSDVKWDELKMRSLSAPQLRCAREAFSSLTEEIDRQVPSWSVKLDEADADPRRLMDRFKKKTRQQLRQTIHAFEELGAISLDIAPSQEDALRFFEEMGRLHSVRWSRVGKLGSFANERWVRFHRAVIAEGFGRGEVVLARAMVGTEAVGYIYGFLWRGRFYGQQTGFKPHERTALRSGYLTHFLLMQHCAANLCSTYDLLPDDEWSYKRHLGEPDGELTTARYRDKNFGFTVEHALVKLRNLIRRSSAKPYAPRKGDTPA